MPCWIASNILNLHDINELPKYYKNIMIKKKKSEIILRSPSMWVDK